MVCDRQITLFIYYSVQVTALHFLTSHNIDLLAQLSFHMSGVKQVSEQHLILSQSLERKQT